MAKKKENTEIEEKEECGCEKGCSCGCGGEKEKCNCNENNEYIEALQRLQAEFDNYRKRSADIVKNARIDGMIDALAKIFPAIDSIEKAKLMIKDEKVLEGVLMIEKELKNSLKNLGIEEIDVLGKPLDPKLANVVAVTNDNSLEDGVIAQVYQAGYKLKDRILRYAQVVVNRLN